MSFKDRGKIYIPFFCVVIGSMVSFLCLVAAGTWKDDVILELDMSDPQESDYDCNYLDSHVCPPLLKNYCCPGKPCELAYPTIDNTLDITVAVSADMQLEVRGCDDDRLNEDKFQNTMDIVSRINDWCRDNGCVAVLAPGDLTQHSCVQELIAFRQLYEHDYPGIDGGAIKGASDDDYDCYSGGDRILYPVFPILGNHDDPSEIQMECDHYWDPVQKEWFYSPADAAKNWCSWGDKTCHRSYVRDYIGDRLSEDIYYPASEDVAGVYGDNYAFELGSFHFIMGGIWPGYGGYDSDNSNRNRLDPDKLKWLVNYLEKAVGTTGKAVVLAQHFGWDHDGSIGDNWWHEDMAGKVVDVLCRRYDPETTGRTTDVCDPYNVVAIITGHTHDPLYIHVDAGTDAEGYPVTFDNYVVSDSGPNTNEKYGWLSLHLTDEQLEVQWQGPGPSNVSGGLITKDIKTSFVTWAHGEPNNWGGNEHCAEFLANGRYNDLDCAKYRPVACKYTDGSGWWIYPYGLDWDMAMQTCEASAEELSVKFGVPESVAEQKSLMNAIAEQVPGQSVWINYTDRDTPGEWKSEDRYYLEAFRDGQPNNGDYLPEKGWGENCGALKFYDDIEDVAIRDGRCEGEIHPFLCRNEDNWYYVSEAKGIWKEGFDICAAESGMEEGAFAFPGTSDEYWNMDLHQVFNIEKAGQVWVSLNDIEKEGFWIDSRPWTDDLGADENKDCAVFHNYCTKEQCDEALICDCIESDWKWEAVECTSTNRSMPYACRSDKTGEWRLTTAKGVDWLDGFEQCRALGGHWYFDAPINASGNTDLFNISETDAPVWLNYTDAKQEGLWRRGRWEYWDDGEPNNKNGNENCGILKGAWQPTYEALKWNDVVCSGDTKRPIVCVRYNSTDENGPRDLEVGWYLSDWKDIDYECRIYGYRAGIPYCPSEMKAVVDSAIQDSASYLGIWIRYTDRDEEGHWEDWWSGWGD